MYGISGKLEIKFSKKVQVKSSINYQKGTEVLGDISSPSRHAAPLFMTNSLTLKIKKVVLKAYHQFNAGYSNEQLSLDQRNKTSIYALDENGLPYSPNWNTFNLKGILLVNDYWMFSGGIENLADIRYRTYSSGISAPGRNYIVAIKVMF